MKVNRQHGFTLIELIVVVAILGILAAFAVPQYHEYKSKTERAVIISDCNALYRGFIVYFIENGQYPFAQAGDPNYLFNPVNFRPLTNPSVMGVDLNLELSVKKLLERVTFEKFDSPDIQIGPNQEFYLVLRWNADPTLRFIVAQSFETQYADGTPVDAGNWLDGVYMSRGGNIVR